MKRLLKDKRANVAMTFALALTPIAIMSGAATDFSYASMEQESAQSALDSATLAGAKNIGLQTTEQIQQAVKSIFAATYKPPAGTSVSIPEVIVDTTAGKVTSSAIVKTETHFMPLIDIKEITEKIMSQVAMGNNNFDVVMVLDTSGSMGYDSKIETLKTAANNLTTTLLNMNTIGGRTDRVQLGIVPFSGAVNVGPTYGPVYSGTTRTSDGTGKAWLDVSAQSSIHNENWNTGLKANRFDLFAKLAAAYSKYSSKLTWAGCVEMRPYPYSVQDTPPSASNPDTLFVPMFAPDEAGYSYQDYWGNTKWVNGSNYNNYLSDDAGSCSATPDESTDAGKLSGQGRTCKYDAPATTKFQKAGSLGVGWGPNYYCRSKPILPMTMTQADITNKISSLTADGNTDILEGVAWGLRVLSPGEPFTQGRMPTDDQPLQRVMIVMTDGENTYETNTGNYNMSSYGSYGFLAKNRLKLASISTATVKAKQDALTLEACTAAKNAGVTVFVVAFEVTATDTINMLKSCASANSYFFPADSNNQLLSAFETIANQISRLRIAG